ncbi:MAG: DinB family protein [Ferruginibacter sp.]
MIQTFLKELEAEATTTRKMLSIIPDDKYQWKPHPKSMTIQQLATHIAELPAWVAMVFNTSELDFAANPYAPKDITSTTGLMQHFEQSLIEGRTALESAKEEQLSDFWTLRTGEQILSKDSKEGVIRMTFSQIIHHRAQLGVFLRLLDVPIPGSYGPSADESFS